MFFRKKEEKIRAGQVWMSHTDNPFEKDTKVTVVDVKDGYVQYRFYTSTGNNSCCEEWFREMWPIQVRG